MSSYLGRGLEQVDNISKLDNLSFNGGTTYALTKDSSAFTPISSNAILISVSGVIQQGNFSVDGTNIVFNTAVASSESCDFIMHYGTGVAFTPADSSITKDKTDFVSTSSSAGLTIKGDGTTDGYIGLSCSQNSHAVKIKAPSHSSSQSYTLTLPGTAPAANKMLQTDGSGNLSFVDAPSGTLVQTGRTVISGGNPSGIDVNSCFSSTYDSYLIVVDRIESTVDSQTLFFRLRNSGGSVTASNYRFSNAYFEDDGNTERQYASASSRFEITNDTDDSSNSGGLQGLLYVHRPADANTMTRMNMHYSFFDSTANDLKIAVSTCNYENPEEHTGIGLNITAGGIRDGGSITVYGIKYT